MNISTQQLGRLVRQYPEFLRYGQKLLEHLTSFAIEQKGGVNNENFVHYLEQQKDFEKGELAKIRQGLDDMPAEKDISRFSRDLYTTVLLSGERDSKIQKAIAQAMFVLGAHYAAALMAPQPPLPVANKVSNLSQLSSPTSPFSTNVDNTAEPQRAVWSRVSTDGEMPVNMDQPSGKTDLRKRTKAQKKIAEDYSAAQAAAQQQQAPQQAIGRRRKKKKSLMWRLAKITGGATAVSFGGGLFWAGTSQAASVLTDFILK